MALKPIRIAAAVAAVSLAQAGPAQAQKQAAPSGTSASIDRLVAGIQANPTDAWVFEQMTPTVEAFYLEDTEAREPCVDYLARIFKILGIKSDRGAFIRFMISV